MNGIGRAFLPAVAAAMLLTAAPGLAAAHVTFSEMQQRVHPKADIRLSYGPEASQVVDLWLPKGPGPHPVVVVIHGGCWIKSIAGLELMDFVANDLRRHGIAVWNIEYRRIEEPGAGYPGTFLDTGAALDLLGASAAKYRLNLDRVVAVGHSAGGHLALWAAARSALPKDSPLWTAHPQKIDAVVGLGQLGDLRAVAEAKKPPCGGAATIASLVGPPTAAHPDVYADTSPDRLEPSPARKILIHGSDDTIAPPVFGEIYRDAAAKRGAKVELSIIAGADHFDIIAPETAAWARVRAVIEDELRRR
jgi:acetyl esterase/lipase